MSKSKSISFPSSKDEKFHNAFNELMIYLALTVSGIQNYVRLGIDEVTQYLPLKAFLTTWNGLILQEKDPSVTNSVLAAQKEEAKDGALSIILPERILLKAKEKVTPGFLNVTDKKMFFIADDNVRTPGNIPTETPVITIEEILHLEHKIRITDKDNPESKALPPDADKVELRRYIGKAAPVNPDLYNSYSIKGKSRSNSTFTADLANMMCWYIARFLNAKGEGGKWSAPIGVSIAIIGSQQVDPVSPVNPVPPVNPSTT